MPARPSPVDRPANDPQPSDPRSTAPLVELLTGIGSIGVLVVAVAASVQVPYGVLVAVGTVQAVNSGLRYPLGHHEVPVGWARLLEFAVGCVAPLAIGVYGLAADPGWGMRLSLGLAALVLAVVLVFIADALASDLEERGKTSASQWIGRCTCPQRLLRTKHSRPIEDLATGTWPPLGILFRPMFGLQVSGSRWLMNAVTLLVGAVLCFSALQDADAGDDGSRVGVSGVPDASGADGADDRPSDPPLPDPDTKSDQEPRSDEAFPVRDAADDSPPCASYRPGEGLAAYDSMRGDFERLFEQTGTLSATPPVALEGRCLGRVVAKPATGMAYQGQYDARTGALDALAIDSSTWGPALVLAPAAKLVLRIVEGGRTVGASQRVEVADGDLYLLRFGPGTRALIRRRTVRRDGATEPYHLLPFAVTAAWRDQMRLHERWLWLVVAEVTETTRTYDLVAGPSSDGEAVASVVYRCDARTATVGGQPGWSYGPDGTFVDERELDGLGGR